MNELLEKSITVRQFFKYGRWLVYLATPIYVIAFFINSSNLKTGGISLNGSPFLGQIAPECLKYAGQSQGGYSGGGRTISDNFLLRGRISRGPITSLINGPNLATKCFGYALLGGLHDPTPGDADFTEEWLDERGEKVITVSVRYNRTYTTPPESK